MQVRSKAFVRIVSRLREVRAMVIANSAASQEASPLLIFIAVVLALLLAILVVDLHHAELQALWLIGDAFLIDAIFKSP